MQRKEMYCSGHGAHDIWHTENVSSRGMKSFLQDVSLVTLGDLGVKDVD